MPDEDTNTEGDQPVEDGDDQVDPYVSDVTGLKLDYGFATKLRGKSPPGKHSPPS